MALSYMFLAPWLLALPCSVSMAYSLRLVSPITTSSSHMQWIGIANYLTDV